MTRNELLVLRMLAMTNHERRDWALSGSREAKTCIEALDATMPSLRTAGYIEELPFSGEAGAVVVAPRNAAEAIRRVVITERGRTALREQLS